ncbi:MAG: hypothetical protein IJT97_08745 [Bacteroidaceae bacterium]|nr:hypothetical protein [Bacteroidaceae bacterium]
MKRVGFLTERIADLDNLYLAFVKACRGKQRKQEVLEFRREFDRNISGLRQQILTGDVKVGNYHYFTIHDPKERTICAAPFVERVLHHAIMNVCHEHFDRSLIPDTYATRPGKGVYAALDRAVYAATHYRYLAKLDFRKYYDSINHDVLKRKLQRKFKDKTLLGIFAHIIDSYHADTGVGLPIGNLTSQYFANVYLSDFDHRAKERLHVPVYIRYMDDILMAADSKPFLVECVRSLNASAQNDLHLKLKPPIYSPADRGVVFLGYKVLPYHYVLSGRSKRRFRTKLITYEKRLLSGEWTESEYAEHILPLVSFVAHADSRNFRKSCLDMQ